MTEILSAVSPSVFSRSMLGRRSSAAFLLPRPEKGVWWPTPCQTHPVRVAAVALKLTDLVSISRNAATGRVTWRHLSSSPVLALCSDDFAVHSRPLLCLQRQVVKLASRWFCCWNFLRNNNMATNLHVFTSSYDSRRFAACEYWTQVMQGDSEFW